MNFCSTFIGWIYHNAYYSLFLYEKIKINRYRYCSAYCTLYKRGVALKIGVADPDGINPDPDLIIEKQPGSDLMKFNPNFFLSIKSQKN